jgi:mono/diheme cytochrome c family protein
MRVFPLVTLMVCMPLAAGVAQGEHTQGPGGGVGSHPSVKTHDDLQSPTLPPLQAGITIMDIVRGDSIYHGKGGCFACHGVEAEGRPAAGDALTVSLNWAQYDWHSIDSLIDRGIPQVLTRSPMEMPARGGRSNLNDNEVASVAKYVWAISQTRGEPWPGGHSTHASMTPAGAAEGTATGLATKPNLPTVHRTRVRNPRSASDSGSGSGRGGERGKTP